KGSGLFKNGQTHYPDLHSIRKNHRERRSFGAPVPNGFWPRRFQRYSTVLSRRIRIRTLPSKTLLTISGFPRGTGTTISLRPTRSTILTTGSFTLMRSVATDTIFMNPVLQLLPEAISGKRRERPSIHSSETWCTPLSGALALARWR